MNITFIIPYFYPAFEYGGQPRSAFDLARALVQRGHNVKVLTTDSAGHRRNIDGMEVIYYANLSGRLAYSYRVFSPIRLFLEGQSECLGADILHVHELRSTITPWAHKVSRRLSIPYVLSTHGGLRHLGRRGLKVLYDAAWGTRVLRHASAVITVSPIEKADAIRMNVPAACIRELPNVIDETQYSSLPEEGAFRARWTIGSPRIILFLGRLHWLKGADLLLQAFYQLRDKNIHLVLAGPNDGQEPLLRRKASDMGVQAQVTFTGFLDHQRKLEALVDASLIVVPSRSEVFAISAGEALICGKRVLLSSACGFHPMPRTPGCAAFFRSEDIEDLAEKIKNMVYDDPVPEYAQACRRFVVHEFSLASIGMRAEGIYREVLQRKE